MARVALVTSSPAAGQLLKQALPAGHDGVPHQWREDSSSEPSQVAHTLAAADFDVVCLGHGVPSESMLEVAEALDRLHPEMVVVLLADPDAVLMERALRAGVRDVIPARTGQPQFTAGMLGAIQTAERRRAALNGGARPAGRKSRVITVLSPKGGSGKTMVATNLAVGLAARAPGAVAIVDLDAHFGDVAAMLSLNPVGTLGDVAASPTALDATVLKVLLTPREPGLFALCAPDSPAQGDEITHEHAAASVRLLGEAFGTVVVDTAAGLDENTLAAIEASTDLLLVCTMDVASVRSLRKELDALERLGMTTQERHFVLNRCDSRVGLESADIEAVVGLKAMVNVPSSRAVPSSMNRGIPVLEAEARSPVAKALGQLVERFIPSPVAGPVTANGSSNRKRGRR